MRLVQLMAMTPEIRMFDEKAHCELVYTLRRPTVDFRDGKDGDSNVHQQEKMNMEKVHIERRGTKAREGPFGPLLRRKK